MLPVFAAAAAVAGRVGLTLLKAAGRAARVAARTAKRAAAAGVRTARKAGKVARTARAVTHPVSTGKTIAKTYAKDALRQATKPQRKAIRNALEDKFGKERVQKSINMINKGKKYATKSALKRELRHGVREFITDADNEDRISEMVDFYSEQFDIENKEDLYQALATPGYSSRFENLLTDNIPPSDTELAAYSDNYGQISDDDKIAIAHMLVEQALARGGKDEKTTLAAEENA